ncbi:YT521-B-like domain-containing protein [Trichoderma austrokoningii]
MGDRPAPPDSGTESVGLIMPEPTTKDSVVPQNQHHEKTTSGHDILATSQQTPSVQPPRAPASTFVNRHGPYNNMTAMANALPLDNNYHRGPFQRGVQQRYHHAGPPPPPPPPPPMGPPMQQMSQYNGPSPMNMVLQGYYVLQSHQMSPYCGGNHLPINQINTTMMPRQNMAYYPSPMDMGHAQTQQYYYPQATQYPVQNPNMQQHVIAQNQPPRARITQPAPAEALARGQPLGGLQVPLALRKPIHDEQRGSVRGSSRKPRQTGNAVWIGNLPPQTDLMSLVHHVSKEAAGLESLFLIAKSNCAFANFKDEDSCVNAQLKLHESRFQSIRLVSRLRKNETDGPAGQPASTAPAPSTTNSSRPTSRTRSRSSTKIDNSGSASAFGGGEYPTVVSSGGPATKHDRFFILKSLTVDDLELSFRTGIWATQSHNEETLTNAFKQCNNVYLIFSANKSGEYFGYARMASEFSPSLDSTKKIAPVPRTTTEVDLPKETITEATEYVPKGIIIDDPARGTVFWEKYQEETEKGADAENNGLDGSDVISTNEEEDERSWGKPFRVEWLSTSRLPFHRIRGLRNPWNSNREVKIARDGTEIEPSIGQRLIGLFNTQGTGPSVGAGSRYQQIGPFKQ